jgi:hypothetical protein
MKIIMLLLFACCSIAAFSQKYVRQDRKQIIGTWIAEDEDWKFVFTPDICREYHGGSLTSVYQYRISADSLQCDQKVYVNKEGQDHYLQLTPLMGGYKLCYQINGVNAETLSLGSLAKYQNTVFKRDKLSRK